MIGLRAIFFFYAVFLGVHLPAFGQDEAAYQRSLAPMKQLQVEFETALKVPQTEGQDFGLSESAKTAWTILAMKARALSPWGAYRDEDFWVERLLRLAELEFDPALTAQINWALPLESHKDPLKPGPFQTVRAYRTKAVGLVHGFRRVPVPAVLKLLLFPDSIQDSHRAKRANEPASQDKTLYTGAEIAMMRDTQCFFFLDSQGSVRGYDAWVPIQMDEADRPQFLVQMALPSEGVAPFLDDWVLGMETSLKKSPAGVRFDFSSLILWPRLWVRSASDSVALKLSAPVPLEKGIPFSLAGTEVQSADQKVFSAKARKDGFGAFARRRLEEAQGMKLRRIRLPVEGREIENTVAMIQDLSSVIGSHGAIKGDAQFKVGLLEYLERFNYLGVPRNTIAALEDRFLDDLGTGLKQTEVFEALMRFLEKTGCVSKDMRRLSFELVKDDLRNTAAMERYRWERLHHSELQSKLLAHLLRLFRVVVKSDPGFLGDLSSQLHSRDFWQQIATARLLSEINVEGQTWDSRLMNSNVFVLLKQGSKALRPQGIDSLVFAEATRYVRQEAFKAWLQSFWTTGGDLDLSQLSDLVDGKRDLVQILEEHDPKAYDALRCSKFWREQ